MNYLDLGYTKLFNRGSIASSPERLSPTQVRSVLPSRSLDALYLGTTTTFTTSIVFSATDNDTASWTQGTINFPDGTISETISSGNTGDISATTFIYYDKGSKGELKTTTTASSAVGSNKILMCVVEKVSDATKLCKVTPVYSTSVIVSDISANQITSGTITSGEIAAGAITTSELAASSVTADKISVSTLSAITADMGSITAGTIIGGMIKTAASGARVEMFPDTNTGIIAFDDVAGEVFKVVVGGTDVGDIVIGDYAGNKGLKWDKSAATFTVRGTLNATDLTAGTIDVDRISAGSIINSKVDKPARAYKYIVASSGGDYTDIQSAIDAANADGGGRIFVKSGTYIQSSDITMYSNIEIVGEDNDSTVIDFDNTAYALKIEGTALTHKKNILLRNLAFNNSKNIHGSIVVTYVDDLNVNGCKFQSNKGTTAVGGDLEISSADRILIEGCYSYVSNRLVFCDTGGFVTVRRNHIEGSVTHAIGANGIEKLIVLDNFIDGASGSGVSIDDISYTRIIGNVIDGFGTTSNGIDIAYDSVSANKVLVSNNIVVGAGAAGEVGIVAGQNSSRIIVEGNQVTGCGNKGIWVVEDNCVLMGNIVTACNEGVVIDATADRTITVGNHIYGNTVNNLVDNGTNGVTSNNITT